MHGKESLSCLQELPIMRALPPRQSRQNISQGPRKNLRALRTGPHRERRIVNPPQMYSCPTCRNPVAANAWACPKCGHAFRYTAAPRSVAGGVFGGLFAFFILLPLCCLALMLFFGVALSSCDRASDRPKYVASEYNPPPRHSELGEAAVRQWQDSPEAIAVRAEKEKRADEESSARREIEQARELQRITEERARPARERLAKVLFFQHQQASNGLPSFQYELGRRYFKGDGVNQDLDLARHWLTSACTNGSSLASNLLLQLSP